MACEPFDCEKCGQRHERCTGHVDSLPDGTVIDLRPCNKWPRQGVAVCQKHGGNAPQIIAAAGRKLEEAKVRAVVDRLGLSIEISPIDSLLDAVYEASGNVEFYRSLVAALPTHPENDEIVYTDEKGTDHYKRGDPGIYGRTYHLSGVPTGEAKKHILVQMYDEERDRLARYRKDAISLGIEERRVQLEENRAAEVFRAVTQALTAMGLGDRFEDFRGYFAAALAANRQLSS